MNDLFLLEDCLWVSQTTIHVPIYDFDFRQYFDCRIPYGEVSVKSGVARVGAFEDYKAYSTQLREFGVTLVHSESDHYKCTQLPKWYPLIEKFTPRSIWYSNIPSFEEIEENFELPVFVKGSRQTAKHSAEASIISNRDDYDRVVAIFKQSPILHWQEFVCREYISLRSISGGIEGKVPASFEFRTFWWKGQLVGDGRYWFEAKDYNWSNNERTDALAIAKEAVERLNCDFVVIDLAMTCEGEWIIIECNDGMESGYAGVSPFSMWGKIIAIEKS